MYTVRGILLIFIYLSGVAFYRTYEIGIQNFKKVSGLENAYFSDLLPRLVGADQLIKEGKNPYLLETRNKIQEELFGRKVGSTFFDQSGFFYPIIFALIISPLVFLNSYYAHLIFNIAGLFSIIVGTYCFLLAIGWNRKNACFAGFLALGWYGTAGSIVLTQPGMIVYGILGCCSLSFSRSQNILGGFLLALAWIKPQHAWLPTLVFFINYYTKNENNCRIAFFSFFCTAVLIETISEILLPGWISHWIYTLSDRPAAGLFQPYFSFSLSVCVQALLLVLYIYAALSGKIQENLLFISACCLTGFFQPSSYSYLLIFYFPIFCVGFSSLGPVSIVAIGCYILTSIITIACVVFLDIGFHSVPLELWQLSSSVTTLITAVMHFIFAALTVDLLYTELESKEYFTNSSVIELPQVTISERREAA